MRSGNAIAGKDLADGSVAGAGDPGIGSLIAVLPDALHDLGFAGLLRPDGGQQGHSAVDWKGNDAILVAHDDVARSDDHAADADRDMDGSRTVLVRAEMDGRACKAWE